MGDKLLQHKHCQVCGKAMPLTEDACSPECQEALEANTRRRKRGLYLNFAMIICVVVLFIIFMQ